MPEAFSGFGFILGIIVLVLALKSFGINQEYQRGVVFRLGRLKETKGPGWFWLIPLIEIGVEHNSTIVAMFPTELLEAARRIGVK